MGGFIGGGAPSIPSPPPPPPPAAPKISEAQLKREAAEATEKKRLKIEADASLRARRGRFFGRRSLISGLETGVEEGTRTTLG